MTDLPERQPEFADNPVDRAAIAAMLTAAGEPRGPDAPVQEMNALWDRLAAGLRRADDATFDAWVARVDELVEGDLAPEARASMVVAELIRWRIDDV